MERLSPLDAAFLDLERDVQELNVGSVLVFEGPAPEFDAVVGQFEALLPRFPRYRQRVRRVPLDLGLPVWVDDPRFQVRDHVAHVRLAQPGSDDQLRDVAVGLIARPLDLDRPLWRCWFVTGLADGRWALANTNHHAMIDGISGADIVGVMLHQDPATPAALPAEVPWRPGAEPSRARLAAHALASAAMTPVRATMRIGRGVAPGSLRSSIARMTGLTRVGETFLHPELGLTGPLGPERSWGWVSGDLTDVKAVRARHGGTVNDVVLAVVAGGFRRLLEERGARVTGRTVRTMVPVSMRAVDEHGRLGNRVSAVFADLPVGTEDPVERLHLLTRRLHDVRTGGEAIGMDTFVRAGDLLPGAVFALGVRAWARTPQRVISTVTTNVPGPRVPLYLLGRRMTDMYPYIPLGVDIRITVGVTSYAGRITFGVTGDRASVPDLDVLCQGIEQSLDALVATTAPTPERSETRHA
jgi:diacylglycerol O-acyltransferase